MVLKTKKNVAVETPVEDLPEVEQPHESDEQPIIGVSQEEIKKALRLLLERESELLAMLYGAFDEYNKTYFNGALSIPLITVEKLSARTLGNYTYGKNNIPVKNHIRMNRDFVALNTMERVLETLRHEMIHQWQDEVIYAPEGKAPSGTFQQAMLDEEGNVIYIEAAQKKRPKEWHNTDFKDMAKVVGIPANGPKCTGNPAKMRDTKSYNRKFTCKCPTSNNYPVTIWSTREIHAVCSDCGQPFVEVKKNDPKTVTIEVKTSHVEQPGQDAVQDQMLQKYKYFERFTGKKERNAFLTQLNRAVSAAKKKSDKEIDQGVYQKGHNAYNMPEGYRYWVAFNVPLPPVEVPGEAAKPAPAPEPTKPPEGAEAPQAKRTAKAKADAPAKVKKVKPRVWDVNSGQDLLDAYLESGSLKGAAAYFGITQVAYRAKAQELGVDFKTGTIKGA